MGENAEKTLFYAFRPKSVFSALFCQEKRRDAEMRGKARKTPKVVDGVRADVDSVLCRFEVTEVKGSISSAATCERKALVLLFIGIKK